VTPIVVEQRVAAPTAAVYRFLTNSTDWAKWQGADATIEAVPGGLFRMEMANGMVARGEFVELVADKRVVFTWGWIDHPGVPPGSSTVEIDLVVDGDATLVRLTHTGLAPDEMAMHRAGWEHHLARLALVGSGRAPGPDTGPN